MVFEVPAGDKLKYQKPVGAAGDAPASEPATTTPGPLASLNPVEPGVGPAGAGGGGGVMIPPRPATTLPAPLPKPPLGPDDVNQTGVIRLLSR